MNHKRITIPEFEIYSNPTIKINSIANRRFNLIDRYEQTIEYIVECLTKNCDETDVKNFIVDYVCKYKNFDNLRTAIKQACPQHEITLDKYLVLK